MSTPITVTCPSCKTSMKAPAAAAGKKGRCGRCKALVAIPQADSVPDPDAIEVAAAAALLGDTEKPADWRASPAPGRTWTDPVEDEPHRVPPAVTDYPDADSAPADGLRRRRWVPLAAAAAVLLAVGLWAAGGKTPEAPPETAAAPTPPAGKVTPAPAERELAEARQQIADLQAEQQRRRDAKRHAPPVTEPVPAKPQAMSPAEVARAEAVVVQRAVGEVNELIEWDKWFRGALAANDLKVSRTFANAREDLADETQGPAAEFAKTRRGDLETRQRKLADGVKRVRDSVRAAGLPADATLRLERRVEQEVARLTRATAAPLPDLKATFARVKAEVRAEMAAEAMKKYQEFIRRVQNNAPVAEATVINDAVLTLNNLAFHAENGTLTKEKARERLARKKPEVLREVEVLVKAFGDLIPGGCRHTWREVYAMTEKVLGN